MVVEVTGVAGAVMVSGPRGGGGYGGGRIAMLLLLVGQPAVLLLLLLRVAQDSRLRVHHSLEASWSCCLFRLCWSLVCACQGWSTMKWTCFSSDDAGGFEGDSCAVWGAIISPFRALRLEGSQQ